MVARLPKKVEHILPKSLWPPIGWSFFIGKYVILKMTVLDDPLVCEIVNVNTLVKIIHILYFLFLPK